MDSTEIYLENYLPNESIKFPITKANFIKYCKKLFDRFERIIDEFFERSEIKKNRINEVITIGGTTLIPKIREIINKKFKGSIIKYDLNPKEIVSMGAAIRGAKYLDLSSVKNIKLFDVTNLSLGIREIGNKFRKIIKRSTKIPCANTELFQTIKDNQEYVTIEIYEGEEEKNCKENNLLLGKFKVVNISKKKAGEVKIKVNFQIKDNSILEVSAWEKDNKTNSIISKKLKSHMN